MKKLGTDEIKQIEFNILNSFDRICKQHSLEYCLAYGTCLGAIRHHGFIPWDDDVDVYMPRKDYEMLYELYSANELDWEYKICSSRDGSSYHPSFKIVDPTTVCHEAFVKKQYSIGLWIDVFPLDEVYDESEKDKKLLAQTLKTNKKKRRELSFAVGDSSNGTTELAKLVKKAVSALSRNLDPFSISRQIDENALRFSKNAQRANGVTPKYLLDTTEYTGGTLWMFPYEVIFPTISVQFEDGQFPVPNNYNRYLEICYGDWRTPPTEDEKHSHFTGAYLL